MLYTLSRKVTVPVDPRATLAVMFIKTQPSQSDEILVIQIQQGVRILIRLQFVIIDDPFIIIAGLLRFPELAGAVVKDQRQSVL